jgi:acetyltransferase-like isoleucine patch superfamily enzyme
MTPDESFSPVVSDNDIVDHIWAYGRADHSKAPSPLILRAGGAIELYKNPNEASWDIKNGSLTFYNKNGTPSTRFDDVRINDGQLSLKGAYLLHPELSITHTLTPWSYEKNFPRSTKILLADEIKNFGWRVGDNTYGRPGVIHTGMSGEGSARLSIGKYTQFGANVLIVLTNHKTDTVSSYPFKLHKPYWPTAPNNGTDFATRGNVQIGNDVWIGANVTILSGVVIGHGAVIAANACVTKNVEPYSIVGGNPARFIRHRFSNEQIKKLLQIEWWNWPEHRVSQFLPLITSTDIDQFIHSAEQHLKTLPENA